MVLLKTSLILVSWHSCNSSTSPPTQGLQGQALPLGLLQDPLDMIRFGKAWEVKWTPPQGRGLSEAESLAFLLSSFWNITSLYSQNPTPQGPGTSHLT